MTPAVYLFDFIFENKSLWLKNIPNVCTFYKVQCEIKQLSRCFIKPRLLSDDGNFWLDNRSTGGGGARFGGGALNAGHVKATFALARAGGGPRPETEQRSRRQNPSRPPPPSTAASAA